MRAASVLLGSLLSALALACGPTVDVGSGGANSGGAGSGSATAGSGGAGGQGGGSGGAGAQGGDGGGPGTCDINEVPLLVSWNGGVPDRFFVPVKRDGVDALLFFDTGSDLTFVRLEDGTPYLPDAGTLDLGCDTLAVPGRGDIASLGTEEGLPVIGILGVDYVTAGVTLVDAKGARLVRHPEGSVLPETEGWAALPYENLQDHLIAPAVLDGEAVRLMFDTGAPHILWLGQDGQPGDIEVETSDAEGTVLKLYYGEVALEMAAEPPRTVPVLRAPSFPYLEDTVQALGGNIHGLLGLSALDDRRFVIDGAKQEMLLETQ
jgi:hypothetical protein